VHTSWSAVFARDRRIGFAHQTTARRTDPDWGSVVETSWRLCITVLRNGAELHLDQAATILEDRDGRPLKYTFRVASQGAGAPRTENVMVGERAGDGFTVAGRGFERFVACPDGALGPWRFHRLLLENRRKKVSSFEALLFSPELGTAVRTVVRFGPYRRVTFPDKTERRLQEVVQRMDAPGTRPETLWLDEGGEILMTETEAPLLGPIRIVECTAEEAQQPPEPVELMGASVVPAPVPIPNPRRVVRARYVLSALHMADVVLPEGVGQSVKRLGPNRFEVVVSVSALPQDDGLKRPWRFPDSAASYLRPTPYIESDDPLLISMSREAVGDAKTARSAAEAIGRYVREIIADKTLDMGFASALEAARSRRGDCSEHAVLAAALARAAGLPARIVVGIACVGHEAFGRSGSVGLFVFHVWAEVMIAPDRWTPVDPALGSFDATHIAFVRSSLNSASPLADLCLPILDVIEGLHVDSAEFEAFSDRSEAEELVVPAVPDRQTGSDH